MGCSGFLRTGAPWRDRGIWQNLLDIVIEDPDFEWLIIDASYIKVHPNGVGAVGGNQDMSRTKGGSTQKCMCPWMRMVCQSDRLLGKVPKLLSLSMR